MVGLSSATLGVRQNAITSYGYFSGLGFDSGVPSGAASAGDVFGAAMPFTSDPVAAANLGVINPGVMAIPDGVAPMLSYNAVTQSFISTFTSGLAVGGRTMLFGFTSDLPPVMGHTGIIDDGTVSGGMDPTPAPEPSTLVLLGCALPVGLLGWHRRVKARRADA
jgi:hypothetical protein